MMWKIWFFRPASTLQRFNDLTIQGFKNVTLPWRAVGRRGDKGGNVREAICEK
jgi:hypothetical protein